MLESGVNLVWEADEQSEEEEKEAFHYKEPCIERVFKIMISCITIPFLSIIEPLMF